MSVDVVLVGAGAAGATLGRALSAAGFALAEVTCRTRERAAARCALIGAGEPCDMDGLLAAAARPGRGPAWLLIAVPDDALADVARTLSQVAWPADSVALHLSGVHEVDVLAPLRARGVSVGALHPLASCTDPPDAAALRGVSMALDGDGPACAAGERIVHAVGAHLVTLRPGGRAAWHAGASHAANHLVALVDQALDLFEDAGVPRDAGRAALVPLLAGVLDHLAAHPPEDALTGPVRRGDAGALTRHALALDGAPADTRAAYIALAARALVLARRAGLPEDAAARVAAVLRAMESRP